METIEVLNDMRAQYEALTRKLEEQSIISQRMLRRTTQSRIQGLRGIYGTFLAIDLVIFPFMAVVVWRSGFSLALVISVIVLNVFDLVTNLLALKELCRRRLWDESLAELSHRLGRALRLERLCALVNIPLIALWVPWFAYECVVHNIHRDVPLPAQITFMALTTLVAAIASYLLTRKVFRTYGTMLRDIDEFRQDEGQQLISPANSKIFPIFASWNMD